MNKRSVAFIEPAGTQANVFENYMRFPLMGPLYLGTILHNAGHTVRIYCENIIGEKIDPFDIKADVYCISALTVSANRGRLLAQEIKRIYPDATIIFGGIHASLCPETFEGVADHIIYGEAESIIVDLIEGRITDKIVRGIAVHDMNDLPSVNYSLLEGMEAVTTVPIMTSRGCPFDCNFCTVTKIFGKRFRMQSPERIMKEIRHAMRFFRTRWFFFYDDNFTANRKRVREFCDLLIESELDINWTTQVRSDIADDPELLQLMEAAGCRIFFIGFESIDNDTLAAMHKSQTRNDIEKAIATIRRRGISIHGMFIFGEDHDTPESMQATVDFAIRHHIDTVQFMILTPFPGTQYYESIVAQNRLIHKRWDYYNAMFPVFRPATMSPSTLQRETLRAYERFYSLGRLTIDTLRLLIDIFVDALTWNFGRVFTYSFNDIFIKGASHFIIGKYARSYEPYLKFLQRIEEKNVIDEGLLTGEGGGIGVRRRNRS
ncbi:MAG: B12-binding domain-containing radical SAM protein [Chitinispirillaceae bacterium]|nr:B12-binding domain-containing radical SAM protein [Chitinispirillaceae bacterium]